MNHYPESILTVIKNLSRLPGIGGKTAERLALHLLRCSPTEAKALADSIIDLKTKIKLCTRCFALSDGELCRICSNPARDETLLCIVEQPGDMASLEKSGAFTGLYHILGGVLSPMDGIGPEGLRIRELVLRIEEGVVGEVVLATGTSVEGEATASYLAQRLAAFSLKVTRIASGVPIGGDLKYVDQVTLKRAMDTRHTL